MTFYNAKVDELGLNLKDLESIVQGKSNNLRVVEDGELLTMSNPGLSLADHSALSLATKSAERQSSRQ